MKGHGESKIRIGNHYYTGDVELNQLETIEPTLFTFLFNKINPLITSLFSPSIKTTPNYEKAVSYYRDASETNFSPLAMYNLAYMYEYGLGVQRVS